MKILKARKYVPEPTYKIELELTQTDLKVMESFVTDENPLSMTDIWFLVQDVVKAAKGS